MNRLLNSVTLLSCIELQSSSVDSCIWNSWWRATCRKTEMKQKQPFFCCLTNRGGDVVVSVWIKQISPQILHKDFSLCDSWSLHPLWNWMYIRLLAVLNQEDKPDTVWAHQVLLCWPVFPPSKQAHDLETWTSTSLQTPRPSGSNFLIWKHIYTCVRLP